MQSFASRAFSAVKKNFVVLLLFLAILTAYLIAIEGHGLIEPDEGRYAEIPREMVESGDFITPKLNYIKYFEKPVMLYWMNAASFMVFGENEFAARFPTALCAVLGAMVTTGLGCFMFGKRAGLLAGAVTAFSLLYFAIGTIALTDMPLSFFLTVAFASFYTAHASGNKKWYMAFYASMALGVLTKGLVAIVLPCAVIFFYIILTRKWRLFIEPLYLPGIALFFIISVPWFYMVCRENPDFFDFFFIQEHFLRYTTKMHGRYEPFWFFFPMIPAGLLPWTGYFFSLFSKESVLRKPENKSAKDANIFLLLWSFVILLFFSFSDSKLIPYIAPCMPPLAILIGADIDRMMTRCRWHGHANILNIVIGALFSLAFIIYAIIGDRIPKYSALPIAVMASVGFLAGPLFAFFTTRKANADFKAFKTAFFAVTVSAAIFIVSLTGIYSIMGETRSVKTVSNVIIKEARQGETIAVYGEVLQGIPFYTKSRVMLIDYMGELEFGAKQKEGTGWFPTKDEFLKEWESGRPFVLVVEKERISGLFGEEKPNAARILDVGEYIVLFNLSDEVKKK